MTSWIKVAPQKPLESKPTLFFETTSDGFCKNYLQYLYAYIYSLTVNQPLYVFDRSNSIGFNYPLLLRTFEEKSTLLYTDSMMPSSIALKKRSATLRLQETIAALPIDSLRKHAEELFLWNSALLYRIEGLGTMKFPDTFDVGVHIRAANRVRSQEMPAISIDQYVIAVKKTKAASKKGKINVFVMTDTVSMLEQFKKEADPSWNIYNYTPLLINAEAHSQLRFNTAAFREKVPVYETFIAELVAIQKSAAVVCTMSSSVAKFLYLTMPVTTEFVSLDKKFSPL